MPLFVILVHLGVSATDQGDAAFPGASGASEHDQVHCDDTSFLCRTVQHTVAIQVFISASSSIAAQAAREHVFYGGSRIRCGDEPDALCLASRYHFALPFVIFLELSLRTHHYFSQQGSAQRIMRCLTKGKKHLLQSVKPWSDQSVTH